MPERRVGDGLQLREALARRLDLGARATFGLEGTAVADRERGSFGRELEQVDVGEAELAWLEAADVDDAHDLPAREQRGAEEGSQSLLV